MNSHELKQLQTRQAKLTAELARLKTEQQDAQKAYSLAQQKLRAIEDQIAEFTKEPIISEHALLRYIEREMGVNLDTIKNQILSKERIALIKVMKSCKFPIGNSTAVVKDMVIVSIV